MKRTKVPVRVKSRELNESPDSSAAEAAVEEAVPAVVEGESPPRVRSAPAATREEKPVEKFEELKEEVEMWRDRALRLEAEMDNFRKRQRRLAEDRIAAERERLLRAFLAVSDDMARALSSDGASAESLREGMDLTYQSMMRLLVHEGVEPLEAKGSSFDPNWHEAVATIPHEESEAEPDTVAEVIQPGYRLGERLLRPARVVVAT